MPRTPSICLCLLGTTMLACPAAAQEIAETYILDPLVLSAGVDKVASSTPQSVSVVDAEELEEIAPGNIGDIIATVPGVTGVGSSSFFGQGFNIRGFGSSGSAASESGIIQLIDGEEKYYESYRQGALFVEPDFLKRVEVLRGPGASTAAPAATGTGSGSGRSTAMAPGARGSRMGWAAVSGDTTGSCRGSAGGVARDSVRAADRTTAHRKPNTRTMTASWATSIDVSVTRSPPRSRWCPARSGRRRPARGG